MAITLSEMLKKAKDKGIQPVSDIKDKPWYDGSVLKGKDNKPPTKKQQKANKALDRNQQQISNKSQTNKHQNSNHAVRDSLQQTTNKGATNRKQVARQESTVNQQQTANKQTSKQQRIGSESPPTNYQQRSNKHKTSCSSETNNSIITDLVANQSLFEDLVGLQRILFAYIVSACVESNSPKTNPIFVNDFILIAETDIKTVKTSLYRLEKKQAIYREKFKSGRGGWTIYGLPQQTWEKINEILG